MKQQLGKKNPVPSWEWRRQHGSENQSTSLDNAHVTGSGSLLTLSNLKFDLIAFIEGFESLCVDCSVVYKNITIPRFTRDESETFAIVEPFYGTFFFSHLKNSFFY